MNGRSIGHALAGVGLIVLLGGIAFVVQYCATGCAIWQHDEARSAAEMGCVERYREQAQIEACREIVNGITSKYTKDAGPKDASE